MILDDNLLEKAREAADAMAENDRKALISRAEYHTAVRRLHLGGGSLREIAQALGVSHQRVQQMVNEAGGSWWQKIWKSRNPKRDAVCSFCQRPPSEVKKLVAGPDVYVCDGCLAAADKAFKGGRAKGLELIRAGCSFCGKQAGAGWLVVATVDHDAAVCGDCLKLCGEIAAAAKAS